MLLASVFLARRNLRLGRSDRKGAFRLSLFIFSCRILAWVFEASHVAHLSEVGLIFEALRDSVFHAVYWWIGYVALEPYIRRFWPEALISWTRVIPGRFRDPRVGRDLLVGTAVGSLWFVCTSLLVLAPDWLGTQPPMWPGLAPGTVQGAGHVVAVLFWLLELNVRAGMWYLLSLLLLRILLRNEWVAGAVFVVVWTFVWFNVAALSVISWIGFGLIVAWFVVLLTRFGLVAFIAAHSSFIFLVAFPITADPEKWYWGTSLFALAAVATLGAYGLYTSLAGRPLFGDAPPRS